MSTWVLASSNQGKVREINAALAPLNIDLKPQSEFGLITPEETGLSFVENAILKARFAAAKTGLPALSDDSGIEITALNGEPGIYSARYAGIENDFQANIEKVLSELGKHGPDAPRHARFVSVMVLMRWENDPCPLIAEGYWEGMITETPIGTKGFGYDPIFYDPIHQMTAAEMTPDLKNQISHRAKAIAQLLRLAE